MQKRDQKATRAHRIFQLHADRACVCDNVSDTVQREEHARLANAQASMEKLETRRGFACAGAAGEQQEPPGLDTTKMTIEREHTALNHQPPDTAEARVRALGELAFQSSVDCREKGAVIAAQLPYHNTAELASSNKVDL